MAVLLSACSTEIYRISRQCYLENGKGVTPSALKEKLHEYGEGDVMKTLGLMEGPYLTGSFQANDSGRKEMFYRPNTQSEWAALAERVMGLDPSELEFGLAATER